MSNYLEGKLLCIRPDCLSFITKEILQSLAKEYDAPWLSLGIFLDEKYSTISTVPEFHESLQIPLGSCGKSMISYLCGILHSKKIIDWDIPIYKYIPEFRTSDEYHTQQLNIKDLLNHRWSVDQGVANFLFYPEGNLFSKDDVLKACLNLQTRTTFRETFSYNNLGYYIVGLVLETITNCSLDELLQTHVFFPLEMTQTKSILQIHNKSELACVLNLGKPSCHMEYPLNGSSGLFSSMKDLSLWFQNYFHNPLFTEDKNVKELLKIQTLNKTASPKEISWVSGYGFGWNIKNMSHLPIYSHPGTTFNSCTKLVMIPQINFAFCIYIHSFERESLDLLSFKLIDLFFSIHNYTPKLYHSPNISFTENHFVAVSYLDIILGSYDHDVIGKMDVFVSNSEELKETTFLPNNMLQEAKSVIVFDIKKSPLSKSILIKMNGKYHLACLVPHYWFRFVPIELDNNAVIINYKAGYFDSFIVWKKIDDNKIKQ